MTTRYLFLSAEALCFSPHCCTSARTGILCSAELKCLQMWSQEQGWSRWDLCDGFFLEAGKQNPFTRAALNDCRVSCEKQCFFWTLSCLMKQNRGEAFQILFFKSSAGSSYNKSFSTPISTRILLLSFLPSLGTDQTFNKTKIYVTKGQW